MKKSLLGMLILFSSHCFSATIDDLGYKSIFRTFYPSMFNASMEDDQYDGKQLPQVGIIEDNETYLALMYPYEQYKNAFGEDRYLVLIEKREIDKNEFQLINGKFKKIESQFYGFSNTCHACYAKADLRIFKKIDSGKYELVSSSQKDYEPSNGYGVINLDISNLNTKIKNIGRSRVGFFRVSSDFSHGLETTTLNLISLDENQIRDFYIDIVGSDDSGRYLVESPLSHTLESDWRIVEEKEDPYFPIEITYKGDTYDEKTEKIVKYNKVNMYEYSDKEAVFKLKSSRDYQ
ncbi:hypothetical protein [Acinetobacter puyangensis]|uniref:hypothetical protein n=1 Tax=Acinetobacter puyangensis TaxID=1096779 RepID=UPI003A4DA2A8